LFAVVNQLVKGGVIDDVFSVCFGMVEGDGALLLGDAGGWPESLDIYSRERGRGEGGGGLLLIDGCLPLLQTQGQLPGMQAWLTRLACPFAALACPLAPCLPAEVPGSIQLQYTPLLTSPSHPFYYNVKMLSLAVDGQLLPVSQVGGWVCHRAPRPPCLPAALCLCSSLTSQHLNMLPSCCDWLLLLPLPTCIAVSV
jgi:hypothetical protein